MPDVDFDRVTLPCGVASFYHPPNSRDPPHVAHRATPRHKSWSPEHSIHRCRRARNAAANAKSNAAQRNARGGRIRGGSTISQQTAKNAFLFQGGGYVRKAFEAYFTVLIETLWGKRRIMEVYLNIAEMGMGTCGVDAASIRYFNHDATHLTPTEAGRIAAVLPLPKKRAAIDPRGFVRRHGNTLARYVGVVRNSGLDACLK